MSLILEALKKSEARRQLGEAPGLGTPFTVPRRRRSPLPWIVVLIVVAGGVGYWLLRMWPSAPASAPLAANTVTARPAPANTHAPAGARQAAEGSNVTATATANAPAAARPTPIVPPRAGAVSQVPPSPTIGGNTAVTPAAGASAPPAVNASPQRTTSAASPREPNRAAVAPAAVPAGPAARPVAKTDAAATMPQTAAHTVAAPNAPKARAQPPPAGNTVASPKTESAAAPAPVANANPTPAAPAAAGAPPAPALPLYYELPYDVRKDLPALNLTIHVYAADPAKRFVVVDGERKAEGETLKEGLTLREIRVDGLVLEFRGQRFFYPRPGR